MNFLEYITNITEPTKYKGRYAFLNLLKYIKVSTKIMFIISEWFNLPFHTLNGEKSINVFKKQQLYVNKCILKILIHFYLVYNSYKCDKSLYNAMKYDNVNLYNAMIWYITFYRITFSNFLLK